MSIELKNVSFRYENTQEPVLQNVNLTIRDGEWVGIMGHTGCGKSTLIQLIAGLMEPSGGKILIDEENIQEPGYDRSRLRRKLGIVFQYPEYQLFETTVEKDVAFALKHSRLSRKEIKDQVWWALQVMGFRNEDILKQSPLALSGGEKRRVAIAGVIAVHPKILILDEPIAGLDPAGREDFMEQMKKLNQEGTTILMVSHNTHCICEYAERVLVMDHGRIIEDGPPQQAGIYNEGIPYIAGKLYERGVLKTPEIVKYKDLLEVLLEKGGACQ